MSHTSKRIVFVLSLVAALAIAAHRLSADAPATQPATQPAPPRFGHGGNGLSIAFVCDTGDSMAPKFDRLCMEISKAVEGFHPVHKFSIIFMRGGKPASVDAELLLATPGNKRRAEKFLSDAKAGGATDPIPALDLAYGQHPQLIYLLGDHDFPDNTKVLDEIHKLDPDHHVKVNTIAFLGPADHDADILKLLTQIARESGGTFKKQIAADLDETTQPATAPATRP